MRSSAKEALQNRNIRITIYTNLANVFNYFNKTIFQIDLPHTAFKNTYSFCVTFIAHPTRALFVRKDSESSSE